MQTSSRSRPVASTTQSCVGLGVWLVFSMRSRLTFCIFHLINVVAEMFTLLTYQYSSRHRVAESCVPDLLCIKKASH